MRWRVRSSHPAPSFARLTALVSGLSTHPTKDRGFSGIRGRSDVAAAGDQLAHAAVARGWTVERIQVSESFARLHLHGDGDLLVDIAIDVSAGHPPVVSIVGPTFDPEELAGRSGGRCSPSSIGQRLATSPTSTCSRDASVVGS